jgi:hypothetical protein
VFIAGAMVIGAVQHRLESADWQEMGQQAGFSAVDDGGIESAPTLTDTVDGRPVAVRYEQRTRSSGEGGTRQVTFTFGEAELAGPADEGLVVGPAGGRVGVEDGVGSFEFDNVADQPAAEGLVATETDDLVLVGTSSAAVDAVADGVSGRALRAIRDLNIVSAGDASGVIARWAEARNAEFEEAGSSIEYPVDNLAERVPGDAGTVTVEMEASVEDGDELRRFAEGIVAIADAFEAATETAPASG